MNKIADFETRVYHVRKLVMMTRAPGRLEGPTLMCARAIAPSYFLTIYGCGEAVACRGSERSRIRIRKARSMSDYDNVA